MKIVINSWLIVQRDFVCSIFALEASKGGGGGGIVSEERREGAQSSH